MLITSRSEFLEFIDQPQKGIRSLDEDLGGVAEDRGLRQAGPGPVQVPFPQSVPAREVEGPSEIPVGRRAAPLLHCPFKGPYPSFRIAFSFRERSGGIPVRMVVRAHQPEPVDLFPGPFDIARCGQVPGQDTPVESFIGHEFHGLLEQSENAVGTDMVPQQQGHPEKSVGGRGIVFGR